MARRSLLSRHELEEHRFHPVVLGVVSLGALFLHAYLPRVWAPLGILDLPLIVVLYFSISWRSPVAGTVYGAAMGLLEDLPGNQYIGVNGIAKSVLGYAAASIGLRIDVENGMIRLGASFVFFLMQSCLLFLIQHFLLGTGDENLLWLHELIRAAVNALVSMPVFYLLDRTRVDEVL